MEAEAPQEETIKKRKAKSRRKNIRERYKQLGPKNDDKRIRKECKSGIPLSGIRTTKRGDKRINQNGGKRISEKEINN